MVKNLHKGALVSPADDGRFLWSERSGLMTDSEGLIVDVGDADALKSAFPEAHVIDHGVGIMMPGFVDAHVHFPQYLMAGSHGESLLAWLERYTFPAEIECADAQYAQALAVQFLDQLAHQGTTAAFIFGVSYYGAMEALIRQLKSRRMAAVTGNVWMDRHGPEQLLKSATESMDISERLIKQLEGDVCFGILPRFVPTCSSDALTRCGDLLSQYPNARLQSHLGETQAEVSWVKELHPDAEDYTAVYERSGLLGPRTSFAHGIHLTEREWRALAGTETQLVHCPTANLFLGSGLFNYRRAKDAGVQVGLGTDVGAGTSLCMLETLKACYQVQRLQGVSLSVEELVSMATLGSAQVLGMEDRIGSLEVGKRADFNVLRPAAGSWLAQRWARCESLEERVFASMILGGANDIAETWISGHQVSVSSER
ncbi:MAG: guanine deaminase [Myxococcales bacterium]|nr:guanine deaminase [Myxococcales bacterium]